jgi:hypothetical protein
MLPYQFDMLPYQFLRRTVDLWGNDQPMVFFMPIGFRCNQRKTSRRNNWMRTHGPKITSIITVPVDLFEGVQFMTEILCFNLPKLLPHYYYYEE